MQSLARAGTHPCLHSSSCDKQAYCSCCFGHRHSLSQHTRVTARLFATARAVCVVGPPFVRIHLCMNPLHEPGHATIPANSPLPPDALSVGGSTVLSHVPPFHDCPLALPRVDLPDFLQVLRPDNARFHQHSSPCLSMVAEGWHARVLPKQLLWPQGSQHECPASLGPRDCAGECR